MEESLGWDERAVAYSELTLTPAFERAYDKAIALSGIEGKQINCILDISCGNGRLLSRAIKKANVKIAIGVDFSGEMLRLAKDNLKDAGACVSSKPLEVYKKLYHILARGRKGEQVIEEYRRVYDEYTAIKEKRAGKTLAVLLKQDRNELKFEMKPVADAVFFTFPYLGNLRSTTPVEKDVDYLTSRIILWAHVTYNFCNALNYLKEEGRLVTLVPALLKEKEEYAFLKAIFNSLERAGCRIDHFELEENKPLKDLFFKLDQYQGGDARFLWAVISRTKDKPNMPAIRGGLAKSALHIIKFFELAETPGKARLAKNSQEHWCILIGKDELDLIETLATIQVLIR